jgi:alkaline phosphatase
MRAVLLLPFLLSIVCISQVQSKNAIVFIGDGMGITTITAARIFEGQQKKVDGETNALSFEKFPNVAFVKTYTTDGQIPDSAGTMTAIMTGRKTRSGVIGVGPNFAREDCDAVSKDSSLSLVEIAEDAGLVTGIISTSRITDATPAATYAHAADRRWENDTLTPEYARERRCGDIASQLIAFDHGDGIDLVLGGGRESFFDNLTADDEYPEIKGKRSDQRNLISEWVEAVDQRKYVWNKDQFENLSQTEHKQIIGLFEPKEMFFDVERKRGAGNEPSLEEMTEFAIQFLQKQQGDKGFLLVIEGARIDHANHFKNPYLALSDTVAFSDAVRKALTIVDLTDTLILVTADHSSALAFTGYPERSMPVLASLSYPSLTLMGGDGFQTGHLEAARNTEEQVFNPNQQPAPHAGEDVPAYAIGLGSNAIRSTMEQDTLFDVVNAIIKN